MSYRSILYKNSEDRLTVDQVDPPEYFVDLNLDQVIEAIIADKQDYNLKPFFSTPLHEEDDILYRQEVMKDLEAGQLLDKVKSFAEKMVKVRRYLQMVTKLYYKHHMQGWYLEAVSVYCDAVQSLAEDLSQEKLTSRGMIAFLEYLNTYAHSAQFNTLHSETENLKNQLLAIQYNITIKGSWVRVRKYEGEVDHSKEVEATFEKFKQGDVKNYLVDLRISAGMNHIEAQILDCVVKLFPEIFKELDRFCVQYSQFLDDVIRDFDREIQFYVGYLDFITNIKQMALPFCYPRMTKSKEIHASNVFDIALANSRLYEKYQIICNDFFLEGPERIIIVSGPNQGGKTTFARLFGQMHFLASLGCPVPGDEATLYLFDQIFTHFEKEEDIRNLRGKLQDDLVRIHQILDQATTDSIIIMNEIFTSTTLQDAIFLSKQIMERIIQLGSLCICVSFIDELATLSEQTVSMVSTIVPKNPAVRTYKIIRKPADGLSYAICIAEKHLLTYELIKERIAQ